jgi:glyoxylase-like metal-dependent hydrolase (beta-lactamase superfamily II)
MESKRYTEVAPGVWGMKIIFVNIYMVTTGPEEWVLVDAGLKGSADKIIKMAEDLFGEFAPSAIVLTHGHFDHVGALKALLKKWPVKVYAHPLELPYLTGLSSYPPPDPTAGGGLMTAMSFIYPKGPVNLFEQVYPLRKDGFIPPMPGWQYIHTPGHSPGHVSLFRTEDKLLLAGDAFVNTKSESLLSVISQKKELSGPPKYFTPNWLAAAMSVKKLRDLHPETAATGHGPVIKGDELMQGLGNLVDNFQQLAIPSHGRYVNEPAKTNKKGVQYLPPAPFNTALLCAAFVLSAVAMFGLVSRIKNR